VNSYNGKIGPHLRTDFGYGSNLYINNLIVLRSRDSEPAVRESESASEAFYLANCHEKILLWQNFSGVQS